MPNDINRNIGVDLQPSKDNEPRDRMGNRNLTYSVSRDKIQNLKDLGLAEVVYRKVVSYNERLNDIQQASGKDLSVV
ncbi:MAG: hypothetical protein R3D71_04450 [Rickettsiales bacterium]